MCVNPFECKKCNHGIHWSCMNNWIEIRRKYNANSRDTHITPLICPTCRRKLQHKWTESKEITIEYDNRISESSRVWVVPKTP